jgi:hypothetical protein
MKAKSSQGKAKVPAPYNFHDVPVTKKVKGYSKGPSLPVTRRNTTIENDPLIDKRITKVPMGPGFDQPLEDGAKALKLLKGFRQAEVMTVEKAGWKHNPVRQDIEEAWGRFTGQEQQ